MKQLGLDSTFSVTISANKLQIYLRMLQFLFAIYICFFCPTRMELEQKGHAFRY